ncbi:J domain-containing protein [Aestuariivirga sp.]|uniref:J domain-containing protein n=1 Tax=Aestuariivirga sp. TaxID=2650926 RepID=UPI0025BA79EE|nr:J domain-containing protein [Aestuariivirga sp.]MCA3556455.1 J domain-containing protein [Aestuariivirga sp.]
MFNGRDDKANRTPVFVTLADGSVVTVAIRMPLSNRLGDALNNSDIFLDAVSLSGQQQFISKSMIRSVRSASVPKTDQLDIDAAAPGTANFDPFQVLKVAKNATPEDIRQAYHRMVKLYHPDRIASFDLPDEVMDYVRAMLVRINLAFEQIGS